MAKRMLVLFVLVVVSLLCAGCDDSDLDKVGDFLDNSEASKAVTEAVDGIVEEAEDYIEEMATDAVEMTEKFVPEVSPEASQESREGVIDALDAVGQVVLDADAAADELQACFEQCDGDYPDIAGSKVLANLNCVAECKGQ